jgi:AraC-like DNA-binding protein
MSLRTSLYHQDPDSLVERRTEVGGGDTRLSLYDVNEAVEDVSLRAPHLIYYGMIEGTQVVRVDGSEPLTFEPGESLVISPLQTIVVDFPEADTTPARYITLKIDQDRVRSVLDRVTEVPLDTPASRSWRGREQTFCHVDNQDGVNYALKTIYYLFDEDPPNRDRLIDLNITELIIQILQTPLRPLLVGELSRHTTSGGLAAAVQYIQENLDRHISIDELVEEACMSKSSFYRHFGNEFDMSPLEYITRERIVRARELLSDPENTVTSVSHALGFSSTSHFIDTFKGHEGVTPKQYQMTVLGS